MASPWPILVSFGVFGLAISFISFVHEEAGCFLFSLAYGLAVFGYSLMFWMMDLVCEATHLGMHTSLVVRGIKLGFILFIISELFFFVGFFWAWFHFGLGHVNSGVMWPPFPLSPAYPWGLPLMNLVLLIFSGLLGSLSRNKIMKSQRKSGLWLLFFSIALGVFFFCVQLYEYKSMSFSISDGAYGSSFYMLTGLHGFHVVCGLVALSVQWLRMLFYNFSFMGRSLGLKLSLLYWHFVDVVWVLLFILVYVWPYECGLRATLL